MGRLLDDEYRTRRPVLIGVLNGGFIFLADLIRQMNIELEVDFIRIASYGNSQRSSGKIRLLRSPHIELRGRHVLLIEDIVDSGLSVKYLRQRMQRRAPASLKMAALLLKKGCAAEIPPVEYVGFEIRDHFVVGYGLDYQQAYRNLPAIHILTSTHLNE